MSKPILVYSKSAFSKWLYEEVWPWLEGTTDIEDIDFVIFNYMTGDLMTLETKERKGVMGSAQRDTHNVLRQLLMLSSGATVHTKRGVRPIKYHGHHLLQFQNSTPDDGWVKLDGKYITKEQLITFLCFGRHYDKKEPT